MSVVVHEVRRAVDRAHPRVVPTTLAPPIAQRLNAVLAEQARQDAAFPFVLGIERREQGFGGTVNLAGDWKYLP